MIDLGERLWRRVSVCGPNECWPWNGARNKPGYGKLRINKKCIASHRLAYELSVGPIPKGLFVMHKCDNPPCCNPSHLVAGTARDNVGDMMRKGRDGIRKIDRFGAKNANSKLSAKDVKEIRSSYRPRIVSQSFLAKRYGVTQPAIGAIIRKEVWNHV